MTAEVELIKSVLNNPHQLDGISFLVNWMQNVKILGIKGNIYDMFIDELNHAIHFHPYIHHWETIRKNGEVELWLERSFSKAESARGMTFWKLVQDRFLSDYAKALNNGLKPSHRARNKKQAIKRATHVFTQTCSSNERGIDFVKLKQQNEKLKALKKQDNTLAIQIASKFELKENIKIMGG